MSRIVHRSPLPKFFDYVAPPAARRIRRPLPENRGMGLQPPKIGSANPKSHDKILVSSILWGLQLEFRLLEWGLHLQNQIQGKSHDPWLQLQSWVRPARAQPPISTTNNPTKNLAQPKIPPHTPKKIPTFLHKKWPPEMQKHKKIKNNKKMMNTMKKKKNSVIEHMDVVEKKADQKVKYSAGLNQANIKNIAVLDKKLLDKDKIIENIDPEDGKQSGEDCGMKSSPTNSSSPLLTIPKKWLIRIIFSNVTIFSICTLFFSFLILIFWHSIIACFFFFLKNRGGLAVQNQRNHNPHNNPKFICCICSPFSCHGGKVPRWDSMLLQSVSKKIESSLRIDKFNRAIAIGIQEMKEKGVWKLPVSNSSHNHPPSSDPAAHDVINKKIENKIKQEISSSCNLTSPLSSSFFTNAVESPNHKLLAQFHQQMINTQKSLLSLQSLSWKNNSLCPQKSSEKIRRRAETLEESADLNRVVRKMKVKNC
ncbi:hypothetical protein VP01_729g5 [Puccinia sorghi]|uniref:Uncharacterized protein n=1 Tax=Puccinia sorghi TaxID=27349 RepID=A0A0L6UF71_9BASI|nr:hypothetical protein VP01_729g5 [Puccinia sorghi]